LLEVSENTINRWRKTGRFGAESEGWVKHSYYYYYAPAAVEALENQPDPDLLDQLLAEVREA